MNFDQLSEEQQTCYYAILDHVVNKKSGILILGAFAGTGKTTLIRCVLQELRLNQISFMSAAFTGRAAAQLSKSGIESKTIHSILYSPVLDTNGNLLRWERKPISEIRENCGSAIFIDEASMVPKKIHDELVSIGLPIVYIGDFAQLPPVPSPEDEDPDFNVMTSLDNVPVLTLTKNHRVDPDAAGIAYITNHLRSNNSIPRVSMPALKLTPKSTVMNVRYHVANEFDIILCGTNKTRKKINELVRAARGFDEFRIPTVDETVVCLKNTVVNGVVLNNGELFKVTMVIPGESVSSFILLSLDSDERKIVTVVVENDTWLSEEQPSSRDYQHFGFGYCISCHKSQGSQFKKVLFIDENVSFFLDQQKFRYTATSRASKYLEIGI